MIITFYPYSPTIYLGEALNLLQSVVLDDNYIPYAQPPVPSRSHNQLTLVQ
jgi:hypothetical protein